MSQRATLNLNAEDQRRSATLQRLNGLCALLHGALTVAIVSAGKWGLGVQLFGTELDLNPQIREFFEIGSGNFEIGSGKLELSIDSFLVLQSVPGPKLRYTQLCAAFPFLSCFFHVGAAFLWRDYYDQWILVEKQAPTRWIEYFISATVMIVALCPLAGVLAVNDILAIGAFIALTQVFGWLAEVVARPACVRDEWTRSRGLILTVHGLGWLPQTIAWTFLLTPLINAVNAATEENRGPPPWVLALIGVMLMLFGSFGFVQIFLYACGKPSDYVKGEIAYQALSFIAKGILSLVLLSQVLVLERFDCLYENLGGEGVDICGFASR